MNSNQHVLNNVNLSSQETKIAKLENDLKNWNIPNEPFKKIYEIGSFSIIELRRLSLRSPPK